MCVRYVANRDRNDLIPDILIEQVDSECVAPARVFQITYMRVCVCMFTCNDYNVVITECAGILMCVVFLYMIDFLSCAMRLLKTQSDVDGSH